MFAPKSSLYGVEQRSLKGTTIERKCCYCPLHLQRANEAEANSFLTLRSYSICFQHQSVHSVLDERRNMLRPSNTWTMLSNSTHGKPTGLSQNGQRTDHELYVRRAFWPVCVSSGTGYSEPVSNQPPTPPCASPQILFGTDSQWCGGELFCADANPWPSRTLRTEGASNVG